MHHIPRLSEAVYVGMCRYVGTPTEVRIRREVTDTVEVVKRSVSIIRGFDIMKSGSSREGFRLQSSDVDLMLWLRDHKVICDLSQISLYRIPQHTVILMECEDLPTGFTRLKMMTPSGDQKVKSSCVTINNEIYISSILYRAHMLEFQRAPGGIVGSSIQHGPCATFNHNDELVPEQEANKADGVGLLIIPPFVMLHMLFVLTHHRLGDTVRSQQSLQDLYTLMLYDDGTHVPEDVRDISWQILGICQQTCGDYVGALNSFQCSLQQNPVHFLQKATMFRIQRINEYLLQ
ncbi:uncharacterized protein LOC144626591 [Crassostrea virginica]